MLYLVRHEETPYNKENRFRGSANPGLSEAGKHAALGLKFRLDGKFDRIVSDDYARTSQTAKIIANAIPIEHDSSLEPWDIGEYSGQEKTPTRMREFDRKYVQHASAVPSGGESLNAFISRWRPAYRRYLGQSKKENILLVTHGSNIAAVLRDFKPAKSYDEGTEKPGAIIQVGADGMPQFLEKKLKSQYGAKSKVPYKIMNSIGAMRGNKETAKGRMMQQKHTMKLSQLARA